METVAPQAFIFDCFGVLISDALEAIIAELQDVDSAKAEQILTIVRVANKGAITTDASRTQIAAILGVSRDEYVRRIRTDEVKNLALLDIIAGLRPQYKTALLSNVSMSGLEARFTPDELASHFDVVIASGVIGYAKPEPQAYVITAERLGVRLNECVMIDDRESFCIGAQGVGMRAIRYQSLAQLQRELGLLLDLHSI